MLFIVASWIIFETLELMFLFIDLFVFCCDKVNHSVKSETVKSAPASVLSL